MAEKEGFEIALAGNQALRQATVAAPRSGKVFRLVARRNPFTERIPGGSPAPPALGFKSLFATRTATPNSVAVLAEKEGFEPSRRLPGLHP